MLTTDFDPKKIDQRSGKSGLASYPESMESVAGLGDAEVKQLVGKNESKNPWSEHAVTSL